MLLLFFRKKVAKTSLFLTTLSHYSFSLLFLNTLSQYFFSLLFLTTLSHYSFSLLFLTTLSHYSFSLYIYFFHCQYFDQLNSTSGYSSASKVTKSLVRQKTRFYFASNALCSFFLLAFSFFTLLFLC